MCVENPESFKDIVCVAPAEGEGGIQSLDWIGGLDQWTGTVDSLKSFPNSFSDCR